METQVTPKADEAKKPWQSRTFYVAAVTALVPLIPGVGPAVSAWIAANPELFSAAVGAIFTGLRFITKDKVVIK